MSIQEVIFGNCGLISAVSEAGRHPPIEMLMTDCIISSVFLRFLWFARLELLSAATA